MSSESSPLVHVKSLLKELEPRAQEVALWICYHYRIPLDRDFLKEKETNQNKLVRASRALRKLHTQLRRIRRELESALGGKIGSWPDTIRAAHMRSWDSVMLPILGDVGLSQHFRQRGISDPVKIFDQFITLWPEIEDFAVREAVFLKSQGKPIGSLPRRYSRRFWRQGRMEYVLRQLFEHYSHERPMLVHKIEERIERILHELDRGGRSSDKRGGVPSVREAIRRVKGNERLKHECEQFLKSRLNSRPT